jgi:hypothetical protein
MIYLFLPYFGNFPNYFQLYLDSVEINKESIIIVLITDIDTSKYNIPKNVIIVNLTIDNIRERASIFLLNEYNIDIHSSKLILHSYKLCDFRVIYHKLFKDIFENNNITSNDFVGWCDCDLIFGKISNFINLEIDYSILGYNGHFTAVKNIEKFTEIYKNIEGLSDLLICDSNQIIDERVFRVELIKTMEDSTIKWYKMWNVFCDIIPESFKYGTYYQKYVRNELVMEGKPDRVIKYLTFDKKLEKLIIKFENNEELETSYIHLQKRKMDINFEKYNDIFYIFKNSFDIKH